MRLGVVREAVTQHMSERRTKDRTISVGGEAVTLPGEVYADLQEYIDTCVDRHAIALLREKTGCDHEQACAALLSDDNFDHKARERYLAETNLQEAGPSMADRAADGAKLARYSKKWSKSLIQQNFSTPEQQMKFMGAVVLLVVAAALLATRAPVSGKTTQRRVSSTTSTRASCLSPRVRAVS